MAPNQVIQHQGLKPAATNGRPVDSRAALKFMFSVGIECSNPIGTDGIRVDELELTGHYTHWKKDLALVQSLGVHYLRYGPPIHKVFLGPGKYDWSFVDQVMSEMQRLNIRPIIDLIHFGLPDWLGNFQNPDWPQHVADYAGQFAHRYSWVRYYTPVNEIYVTGMFSTLAGFWNERLTTDRGFVTNIKHCCRASLLVMRALLAVRRDVIFIFSESTEYVHPGSPILVPRALFLNERRFLSLDLLLGHDVSATMYRYLTESGMTPAEYEWFAEHSDVRSHCIVGTDYYITNERILKDHDQTMFTGDIYGYYVITRQYYDRYKMPVMHTETNRSSRLACEWLWKEWMNLLRLREDGVPIVGFTWYGLVDMLDWDSALTRRAGHINDVGLFTLGRKERKVAREYRRIIEQYAHLPISNSNMLMLTA
jgi:beta-glucosidase/6-phospho-beta-glucosidase/beta-galactosidase